MQSVTFGNVELFIFGKKHYHNFRKFRTNNNHNEFYDKSVIPFLDKNYSGKTCVKTYSFGDRENAEKNAESNFRQFINMLRCLICFKAYKNISENLAKINLLGETYDKIENGISINHYNKDITLHYGRGRKSIHKLPIDKESIHDLKSRFFLDDLCSLFTKEPKTEIEKAILTAMHWIGEAQDEFDSDSAFIKYWTALETFYSKGRERLSKSVAKGVPIQLAFGGYGFIELEEIKSCYREINTLYKKRSKIIHRGRFETVTFNELSSICKYAIFSFFSFLGLQSKGYHTLDQVNYEINRLFYFQNYKYLTSKNSKIYHKLTCVIIKKIKPHNVIGIGDDKEILKKKKQPCTLCFR